jgi:threonine aldolase
MNYIDLRSDTVTRPSPEMRKAMYQAEVGDDVYGEDPSVNELQRYAAELLGKEAALFVPSGVMGNQICLNILTEPGDEVICEKDAHIFNYESGSPGALSGIQLYPIRGIRGVINPGDVEDAIRPASAYYMPKTKVISVENTHNRAGGTVYPLDEIKKLKSLAEKYNLYLHLDGARIWNASKASGIAVKEYAAYCDTISCCLSKGLGAPVGSLIAGTADMMKKAFRVRKAWGGGMRQAGILASAGLFALKNNIDRLEEDHLKARSLAECIASITSLETDMESVQTNIIIFKSKKMSTQEAIKKCCDKGLLISVGKKDSLRMITHMDITAEQTEKAKTILTEVFT